jgi:hypothetical protein
MAYRCPYCQSADRYTVDTYKHIWSTCNTCGTVSRERKDKYKYDTPVYRFLINNFILGRPFRPNLLPLNEVRQDEKHFYDYYKNAAEKGEVGTKWVKANDRILNNLAKFGISVRGKNILDISGGPGFLTKRLKAEAKRVVVTEFSQEAVNGMVDALGIEGIKYDYNSDRIQDCINEKFDIIFIVYSVGFCNDLAKFVTDLRPIMNENALVYITYSPPSLGLMIRWQFDEYTYNRCWPIDVMRKCFENIGMKEIHYVDEGDYAYDYNWFVTGKNWIAQRLYALHPKIGRSYLEKALRDPNVKNKELVQHNILQVFQ